MTSEVTSLIRTSRLANPVDEDDEGTSTGIAPSSTPAMDHRAFLASVDLEVQCRRALLHLLPEHRTPRRSCRPSTATQTAVLAAGFAPANSPRGLLPPAAAVACRAAVSCATPEVALTASIAQKGTDAAAPVQYYWESASSTTFPLRPTTARFVAYRRPASSPVVRAFVREAFLREDAVTRGAKGVHGRANTGRHPIPPRSSRHGPTSLFQRETVMDWLPYDMGVDLHDGSCSAATLSSTPGTSRWGFVEGRPCARIPRRAQK